MANHHFGKFADVWKHLVVAEVLDATRPTTYAETHAGSAAYPMVGDAERRYGVLGFLEALSSSPVLASSAYARLVVPFIEDVPSQYPGSALQAMTLLGDLSSYLLCDIDPVSAADLRAWTLQLDLHRCEVAERDGRMAVRELLTAGGAGSVVHIDPFDPFGRADDGVSAVELAAEVVDAGQVLVYWYGFDAPQERSWALQDIGDLTTLPLWCGDIMLTEQDGAARADGNLGKATTAGTGCGLVLANASAELCARLEELADALTVVYEGRPLPSGAAGRLDFHINGMPSSRSE